MNKYTAQTQPKAKGSFQPHSKATLSVASTPTLPIQPSASDLVRYVRFVLHSGHALELREDSIEEISEAWANKPCHAVAGCQTSGVRAVIPVENVAYLEEVGE